MASIRPISSDPPPTTSGRAELAAMLARVAEGDKAAFAKLYAATSAKLYGIVLRILRQRHIADDVLQEVYVRIWENAGAFDAARASPITWMATIARNRALDEARKKTPASIEDLPSGFDVASDSPLALDAMLNDEDGHRLHQCLQKLDSQKRNIVVLAYMEGTSRDELSRRFETPVATIKTWLHRSLSQLKECLNR